MRIRKSTNGMVDMADMVVLFPISSWSGQILECGLRTGPVECSNMIQLGLQAILYLPGMIGHVSFSCCL